MKIEEIEKQRRKRKIAYKCLIRDERNNCSVGMVLLVKKKLWVIGITTSLFVYLLDKKGNHLKITWREWKRFVKYEVFAIELLWNKRIKNKILKLLKKIDKINQKKKKVKRTPAIKKTPVRR